MGYVEIILDEIALEGLEGITVDGLWLRLEALKSKFPLSLDDASKAYLWDIIVTLDTVDFYALAEPRPPLVLFNRVDYTDPDTGVIMEQPEMPNVYPIAVVKQPGVRGSCATFDTRENVTKEIRNDAGEQLMNLSEVHNKWGSRLVLVASQDQRTKTLFGNIDPMVMMNEHMYCMLERIGRSRYNGEMSHGTNSIGEVFNESPKNIFYWKKILVRHGLIRAQMVSQRRTASGSGCCNTRLLHLPRFFVPQKTLYAQLLELLTEKLSKQPNLRAPIRTLRDDLGMKESSFKKLYQLGCKYVKTVDLFYSEVFPTATPKEKFIRDTGKEKRMKGLELMKLYKYGEEEEEDEDKDDSEDEDRFDSKEGLHCRRSFVREHSIINQVYQYLLECGPEGVTQFMLCKVFSVGKLEARSMVRHLERRNLISKVLLEQGRQKVSSYIARQFLEDSKTVKKMKAEKEKTKSISMGEPSKSAGQERNESNAEASNSQSAGDASVAEGNPVDTSVVKEEEMFVHDVDAKLSYRMLKRSNIILETVKEAEFVELYTLLKRIHELEQKEGWPYRADKKSVNRLVERLVREKKVKSIVTMIKSGELQRKVLFVASTHLAADDPRLIAAVENLKSRFSHIRYPGKDDDQDGDQEDAPAEQQEHSDFAFKSVFSSGLKPADMEVDPDVLINYGMPAPRMRRIQMLHQYLWHLVYHHKPEGSEEDNASCIVDAVSSQFMQINQKETAEEGKVYIDDESWKRFIPPIRRYKGYPEGWVLVADALLALPLSLFIKIYRNKYKINQMGDYRGHPKRQHMLLCQLPQMMRHQLMFGRKAVHGFHDILQLMVFQGLISFGKRIEKTKELVMIYIHRNVSLLDTTKVKTPGSSYPIQKYSLDNFKDLENYWFNLQCICMNTPTENIVWSDEIRDENHKITRKPYLPERLENVGDEKTPAEIEDDGRIPGNQLGAGGLDTLFCSHLQRNWSRKSTNMQLQTMLPSDDHAKRDSKKIIRRRPRKRKMQRENNDEEGTGKKPCQVQSLDDAIEMMKVKVPRPCNKGGKGLKRKRTHFEANAEFDMRKAVGMHRNRATKVLHKAPATKPRHNLDAIDIQARQMQTRMRVTWTQQEDTMLLVALVSSLFMNPNSRGMLVVPWAEVRDFLRKHVKEAANKTSLACQRRVRYMLKNPRTKQNVHVYLGEALLDKALVKEYKTGKRYKLPEVSRNMPVFRKLTAKIFDRIKRSLNEPAIQLPDTIAEVVQKYNLFKHNVLINVSTHKDVTTRLDIIKSVIHNLIHCTMMLRDKIGRAWELYQLFNQYPEDLLHSVFNQMKQDGIVTKIKVGEKKILSTSGAHAIGSFRMAQRYEYRFKSRFPEHLCTELQPKLEYLITQPESCKENYAHETKAATTMLIIALLAKKQVSLRVNVPEQIIEVDRLEQEGMDDLAQEFLEEEEMAIMKEAQDQVGENQQQQQSRSQTRSIKRSLQTAKTGKKGDDTDHQTNRNGSSEKLKDALEDEENIQKKSKETEKKEEPNKPLTGEAAGRELLQKITATGRDGKSNVLSQPGHSSVSFIDDDDDEDSEAQHSRKGLSMSRALVLLRRKAIQATNLAPKDTFIIHSCKVYVDHYLQVPDEYPPIRKDMSVSSKLGTITDFNDTNLLVHPKSADSVMQAMRTTQPPSLSDEEVQRLIQNYDETENSTILTIYTEIDKSGILGITYIQLKEYVDDQATLKKVMCYLMDHRLVLKVGVTVIRYVTHNHADAWLIHSFKNTKGRGTRPESVSLSKQKKETERVKGAEFSAERATVSDEMRSMSASDTASQADSSAMKQDLDQDKAQEGTSERETEKQLTHKSVVSAVESSVAHTAPTCSKSDRTGDFIEEISGGSRGKLSLLSNKKGKNSQDQDSSVAEVPMDQTEADIEGIQMAEKSRESVEKTTPEIEQMEGIEEQGQGIAGCESDKSVRKSLRQAKASQSKAANVEEGTVIGPKGLSTYQQVHLLCRPWKTPEGTVNRNVLKMMLDAILMYIMSNPGVKIDGIFKKYNPILQPVPLRELLEILEQLGCVNKICLQKRAKTSLFCDQHYTSGGDGDRENTTITYVPRIDCLVKLSQFLSQM